MISSLISFRCENLYEYKNSLTEPTAKKLSSGSIVPNKEDGVRIRLCLKSQHIAINNNPVNASANMFFFKVLLTPGLPMQTLNSEKDNSVISTIRSSRYQNLSKML